MLSVRGLSVDPRDPDRLTVVAGSRWEAEVEGVYLSRDGGKSFDRTLEAPFAGNSPTRPLGTIIDRDPTDPDRLAVASIGRGVWLSDDNGESWTKAEGAEDIHPTDLAFDRTDPQRLWLTAQPRQGWMHGTKQAFGGGFFRSDDGGRTWQRLAELGPGEFEQSLANPDELWAIFDESRLSVSLDRGETWEDAGQGLPIDPDAAGASHLNRHKFKALGAGPDGLALASVVGEFFYRPAGASAWQRREVERVELGDWWGSRPMANGFEPFGKAIGSVVIDPHDPQRWWFTDWYGLYRSDDAGRGWALSLDGIEPTVHHALLADPTDPAVVHLGLADLGYLRSENGGRSFDRPGRGLGANIKDLAVSAADPRRLYAVGAEGHEWVSNAVYLSVDRGQSWRRSLMRGLPDMQTHRANSIAADPRDAGVAYLAVSGIVQQGGGVYRSDDGGDTWQPDGGGLPTDQKLFRDEIWEIGSELAVSPRGSMLAISRDGRHVYSRSGADAPWTLAEEVDGQPFSVAADPHEPDVFLIGVREQGVLRSDDGGRSWSAVFGERGASHVAYDPAMPGRAAAATADGVVLSDDGGRSWRELDRALPDRVYLNPLAFAGERLLVGSSGSGVFYLPLSDGGRREVRATPAPPAREAPVPEAALDRPEATRLLTNPSMTDGDEAPEGWKVSWTGKGQLRLARDTDRFLDEPASLRLESVGGVARGTASLNLPENLERFTVGGHVSAEGEHSASFVAVQAFDAQWKQLRFTPLVEIGEGFDKWRPFEREVTLPEGTAHAVLAVVLEGDGRIWLDALSLDLPKPADDEPR